MIYCVTCHIYHYWRLKRKTRSHYVKLETHFFPLIAVQKENFKQDKLFLSQFTSLNVVQQKKKKNALTFGKLELIRIYGKREEKDTSRKATGAKVNNVGVWSVNGTHIHTHTHIYRILDVIVLCWETTLSQQNKKKSIPRLAHDYYIFMT